MRAVSLFAVCLMGSQACAQSVWTRYNIPRANVTVDIPTDIFSVDEGSSKTALGRIFRSADSHADLTVYAVENERRETPAAFMLTKFKPPPNVKITYHRIGSKILAISGYNDAMIWYARCNFSQKTVRCIALDYPASEKVRWDPIVTRISNSLS